MAGLFKDGLELGPAVNLHGPRREPESRERRLQHLAASVLVIRLCAASTSLRLITSRAVKWARRSPGSTSTYIVSICTRSPGARGT